MLNSDIAPTRLELAGIGIPPSVNGQSLAPLLAGGQSGGREDFLYEQWGYPVPVCSSIRTTEWKYRAYETGETEL